MDDLPSLAVVRPFLAPKVLAWVNSVIAGETNTDFAKRAGIKPASIQAYSQYVGLSAGLDVMKPFGVREAILRMRIRELEDMLQERATPLRRAS